MDNKQETLEELKEQYNKCNELFNEAYMLNSYSYTKSEFTQKVTTYMSGVIQTLGFLIGELEEFNWINFDEVKPEDGQYVLSVTSDGKMEVLYYDKDWSNCLCLYGGNIKVYNITHWMPLPEPPSSN